VSLMIDLRDITSNISSHRPDGKMAWSKGSFREGSDDG